MAWAAPAAAQSDGRWSAWLGCWQLVDGKAEVCIAPAGAGVTMTTRVENEPALEQTVVADAAARRFSEAGCTGTQRAEWSNTGRTLFSQAELTCGTQAAQRVAGLAFIVPDGTWLDVQGIEAAGGTNVRVRRYRRTAPALTDVSPLSVAYFSEASR
jgi:hypothetical protein